MEENQAAGTKENLKKRPRNEVESDVVSALMDLDEREDLKHPRVVGDEPLKLSSKEIQSTKFTGRAETQTKNHDRLEGEFFAGLAHGRGKQISPKGGSYIGEFFAGRRHGKGDIVYDEGVTYNGQFFDGDPHGKGELVDNIGKYNGEFFAGRRHGHGELVTSTADYVGEFFAGKYHGVGTVKFHCGWSYKGRFWAGRYESIDTVIDSEGKVIVQDDHQEALRVFDAHQKGCEMCGKIMAKKRQRK